MRRRRQNDFDGAGGRLAGAIARYPREFVGIVMGTLAVSVIFINALFLQHGPHPAPIFATRPVPERHAALPRPRTAPVTQSPVAAPSPAASARSQAQIIGDIQRELGRKGFYDGAADGIWGAKTDAAARDFVQAAGVKINAEASESLLQAIVASKAQHHRAVTPLHSDPIADLLAPSRQVLAVQRALGDFGYGQLKPTGVFDAATRVAIQKFERDRGLPVTGEISEALVRELATVTGRPLE